MAHWRVRRVAIWWSNQKFFARDRTRRAVVRWLFGAECGFCAMCGSFIRFGWHKTHYCGANLYRNQNQSQQTLEQHRDWQRAAAQRVAIIEQKHTALNGRHDNYTQSLSDLQRQLNRITADLSQLTQRLECAEQVELGHAQAYVDRFKLLREQVKNLETRLLNWQIEEGIAATATAPAQKVDQMVERYKIVRSYVRGLSERVRSLERAAGISPTLDGPQRLRDQACELLITVVGVAGNRVPPSTHDRIIEFLDRSGYSEWRKSG